MNISRRQNFPRFILLSVIIGALIWFLFWWAQIEPRERLFEAHLSEIGVDFEGNPEPSGFPGYYEFSLTKGTKSGEGFDLSWNEFITILPLSKKDKAFLRISNGLKFNWDGKTGELRSEPLRVQLEFDQNGALERAVAEGRDASFTLEGKTTLWSRLVLAYDKTQTPNWAARLFFEGKSNEVIRAENLQQLLLEFEKSYLQ